MCLLIVINFFLSSYVYANEKPKYNTWKIWKENKNIQVSYQPITDSHLIEIKAQATIKSSISGFLLFLQDVDNIHHWLDNAQSSQILEQITPQDNVFITHFNSYWPVSERYMLIKSRYWQNDDLSLEIQATDVHDEDGQQANKIKIDLIKAQWLITPLKNNTIHIQYNVIADPKGAIPAWLIKRLSLNGLWKTMNNLHIQLPLSPFQHQTIKGIKEYTQ